jgi:hypothetical protein
MLSAVRDPPYLEISRPSAFIPLCQYLDCDSRSLLQAVHPYCRPRHHYFWIVLHHLV